ncbi:lipid II flippase family protein [Modicisalibacter xianhensis]|uniref:Lipid II flippase Amj n=1 Tax=Modicisalibacter xianhensis TaxID=442341 RepID=A0A1I3C745_9GAMM|nr:DUF2837 family protein [Halomonas xianhensis]SFH70320.1 Protein of unknown function [Halomonas xianhensis]
MVFFLLLAVVIIFSFIHLIEVASFFARVAGVKKGNTAFGYALQNSVFMFTRVFTMLLLPLLGYLVDLKISEDFYLGMVALSLLSASFFGYVVITHKERVIAAFQKIITAYEENGKLFFKMISFPVHFMRTSGVIKNKPSLYTLKNYVRNSFFWGGAIIFGIYSISVLMSFYFGLVFYEYRTTISQLSGISNALATVILTFYIEPRMSGIIDNNKESAVDSIECLMYGRVIGTFVCFVFFCLYIVYN